MLLRLQMRRSAVCSCPLCLWSVGPFVPVLAHSWHNGGFVVGYHTRWWTCSRKAGSDVLAVSNSVFSGRCLSLLIFIVSRSAATIKGRAVRTARHGQLHRSSYRAAPTTPLAGRGRFVGWCGGSHGSAWSRPCSGVALTATAPTVHHNRGPARAARTAETNRLQVRLSVDNPYHVLGRGGGFRGCPDAEHCGAGWPVAQCALPRRARGMVGPHCPRHLSARGGIGRRLGSDRGRDAAP